MLFMSFLLVFSISSIHVTSGSAFLKTRDLKSAGGHKESPFDDKKDFCEKPRKIGFHCFGENCGVTICMQSSGEENRAV